MLQVNVEGMKREARCDGFFDFMDDYNRTLIGRSVYLFSNLCERNEVFADVGGSQVIN